MKRRDSKKLHSCFIGWVLTFFICTSLLVLSGGLTAAAESEAERVARLVEGAKKEGKLVWYTTIDTSDGTAILKRFQEKYPFITTEMYRAGGEKMMTRILLEARAKRHLWDVTMNAGINGEVLSREGFCAKYLSPERKFYAEGSKDKEGYWTDMYLNLNVIGYNTRLVPPKDVPRNYEDLLNPKWKGKMSMDTKPFYWFAAMLRIMGEQKGLEYMKKLAKQDIQFRTGKTLISNLTVAGEISMGVPLYNNEVEQKRANGAPMDWIAFEPVIPQIHPLSISSNAAHPNAAKLFVDFVLSREGQELIASFFRIPTRLDVDPLAPRLKKGLKILPFEYAIVDDNERYTQLFRDVLLKK